MGTLLTASCKSCGFVQHGLYYGVGFAQHTPQIPALRKGFNEIVLEEFKEDADLRFYHQPEMYRGDFKKWEGIDPDQDIGETSNFGYGCLDYYLSPEKNFCPGCGKYTMEFVWVGNWD